MPTRADSISYLSEDFTPDRRSIFRYKAYLQRNPITPLAFWSFLIAVTCCFLATLLRIAFSSFGVTFLFTTYYPAVLITALVGGTQAAILLVAASTITVRLLFISPLFELSKMDPGQQIDMLGFLLCSIGIIAVAHWNKASRQKLHRCVEEKELTKRELDHGGKGTYAVISALLNKALEHQPELAEPLNGRIRAIKYANDLISHSPKHTVLLKRFILHEFSAYGENRFETNGKDIHLPADTARQLALVFHEMITNAIKHGALSSIRGKVVISWTKDGSGVVNLEWREQGGPPASPPKSVGFGTKLMNDAVKSLNGTIVCVFAANGFRCHMTFRLGR
jgi:two-component sensor histidine kinase